MKTLPILTLCATLLAAGCTSTPTNPQDPLEPMNRAVYSFNDKVDRAVAKPVAKAYRAITPQPARTAVNNFFDNILDAYSFANNVLSGEPVKAMNDLMRVAINSTLGLFGLVDFATPAGLQSNKNTFGDTLAHWGWKNSNYLVLPLLGPSTIRDGVGTATTLYVSPDRRLVYTNPASANTAWGLQLLGRRERLLGVEDTIDEAALDPYSYTRDAFLQMRAAQVAGQQPARPGKPDASAPAGATPAAPSGDDVDIDQLVAPDAAPSDASAPAARPDASQAK